MQIHLIKEKKRINSTASTVKHLLKKLKIPQTTVLVIRNNELIDELTKLGKSDKIEIYPVVSGG